MSDLFFSNQNYYENQIFRDLHSKILRVEKSEKYTQLEKENYAEIVKFDLYLQARYWLGIFRKAEWWRKGLE